MRELLKRIQEQIEQLQAGYFKIKESIGTPVIPTLQQVLDNNHTLINGNNFQGNIAGLGNTGYSVNAFGSESCITNTGNQVNAFGRNTASGNSGNNVNSFGNRACLTNTGSEVNAFGSETGIDNIFNNVNLFGLNAIADADNQTVFSIDATRMARLSYANITENRKYELPDNNGEIALLEYTVSKGENNGTMTVLTSAQLNTQYPTATTGFKVYCTSIIAGKMTYEKIPGGWIGMTVFTP